jgi:hypothetical protein
MCNQEILAPGCTLSAPNEVLGIKKALAMIAKPLISFGAPAVIRTRGLRIRSPLLYPAELQAQTGEFVNSFNFTRKEPRETRSDLVSRTRSVLKSVRDSSVVSSVQDLP